MRIALIGRTSIVLTAMLLAAGRGDADILNTTASLRPDNSLLVDINVTTDSRPAHLVVTYQATGVDPLVSRAIQVSSTGSTTITVGRLRANTAYTYTANAFDRHGETLPVNTVI